MIFAFAKNFVLHDVLSQHKKVILYFFFFGTIYLIVQFQLYQQDIFISLQMVFFICTTHTHTHTHTHTLFIVYLGQWSSTSGGQLLSS
jgi:hypothetical protein